MRSSENASTEQIRDELKRVFTNANYETLTESGDKFVFTREATQKDRLLLGDLKEERLSMEIEVSIEPFSKGGYLVRADAFVVRDDEYGERQKVSRMARGQYKTLLLRARANLIQSAKRQGHASSPNASS